MKSIICCPLPAYPIPLVCVCVCVSSMYTHTHMGNNKACLLCQHYGITWDEMYMALGYSAVVVVARHFVATARHFRLFFFSSHFLLLFFGNWFLDWAAPRAGDLLFVALRWQLGWDRRFHQLRFMIRNWSFGGLFIPEARRRLWIRRI